MAFTHIVTLGDEQYLMAGFDAVLKLLAEHADEARVIVVMPVVS